MGQNKFHLFAGTQPGLEAILAEELQNLGFHQVLPVAGGAEFQADMAGIMRANLCSRVASKILLRLHTFKAGNLSQLMKRAKKFPWEEWIPEDMPVRIKASCKKSRIYHTGAVEERIRLALSDSVGGLLAKPKLTNEGEPVEKGMIDVMVRVHGNNCTINLDTSGTLLHKRGYRLENAKAPLRENLASAFLMLSGWKSPQSAEEIGAFVDPMCGSGTLAIEAAQIAMGIPPGLNRSFAFEHFKSFDSKRFEGIRFNEENRINHDCSIPIVCSDRDQGASEITLRNSARAGVETILECTHQSLSAARPPTDQGLFLSNPPYGIRVQSSDSLRNLYATIGRTYREHFDGWALGIITNDANLARHTGLNFKNTSDQIPHGGLKVRLYIRD